MSRSPGGLLLTEGFIYGIWRRVPWMGLVKSDTDGQWGWVGAPYLKAEYYYRIWHHHCLSLDWAKGKIVIYQDGEKIHEKIEKTLVDDYAKKWTKPINTVSIGCFQWSQGKGETTIGKFADVQIFKRILTDQEMMDITSCKVFLILLFFQKKL